jgi:hypothetical protein
MRFASWLASLFRALFDWFRSPHPPGFSDHMFQSEGFRLAKVEEVTNFLKETLTEAKVLQKGDREVEVQGSFKGRAVVIELGITFGSYDIEMKTDCPLPKSSMRLQHEPGGPDKGRIAGAEQAPDAFGRTKSFVTETLYLEGREGELAEWQALLDKLPEEVRERLYDDRETQSYKVTFYKNSVEVAPEDGDVSNPNASEDIVRLLDIAAEFADVTEKSWQMEP